MDLELNATTFIAIDQNELPNEAPKQSDDLSTNNIEEVHQGDTRLQLHTDEQEEVKKRFGPSTNPIVAVQPPPSNPAEVMESLIKAAAKKKRNRMIRTFLIAVVLIASCAGCFVWYGSNPMEGRGQVVPLLFGILLLVPGIIIFFISWLYCCGYCCCPSESYDQMRNNVDKVILLEGETWQHQVDAIQAGSLPSNVVGFIGRDAKYRRLKKRPYGHIVLAREGIILDELLDILYETLIVRSIDRITNTGTQTGFILRVHLVTRFYVVGGFSKGTPTIFDVDLFMPPQMTSQDVENIAQIIRLYSSSRLTTTGFGR
jgi:hypothetical protein